MRRRQTPTSSPSRAADPTTAWAQDVVSGLIIAGELVRHAAERHLKDLRDGPARGLHWRPELAQRAIDFFPAVFTITAGELEGKPFHLLPWHLFTVGNLFGWRLDSGLCRFRTAYLETGKGQAKSPLMAGLGLYKMGFCGIRRAEVYAIAGTKQQANVLFKDAVGMCRAQIPGEEEGDTLEGRGEVLIRGTGEMAWKIEHPETGSSFTALADGDSVSGPRPVMVAADEIHEFKTADAINLWEEAITKMPGDPLMCLGTNTPAADQLVGTEFSEQYQNVVKGTFKDDTSFAFIARTDPGDDPFADESCWQKSLPALGITFPIENVRARVNKAAGMASARNSVLRLFFGVPVGSSEYWIEEDLWDATLSDVDPEEMRGYPCWLGIDPSRRNDLTALAAVWKLPDGQFRAKVFYWKPRATLAAATAEDKAPYLSWATDGALNAIPGQTIRMGFIVGAVRDLVAKHDVKALAFDLAHFQDFRDAAEEASFPCWEFKGPNEPAGSGLMMIRHAQGARGLFSDRQLWMPRSVQALEDQISDGSIKIDDSPVTRWCSANSMLNSDGQGNRWFDKKRSRGRIDGMVAIAMALGAATAGEMALTVDTAAMIA
ncbi:terminase large subunit [Roseococcus sp. YIM B11640]|uniref:terminase large subunit n=1 Tax=Roseococcus sp. YIM B11640 TaxID=3133973 RepID=UPI003C7E1677